MKIEDCTFKVEQDLTRSQEYVGTCEQFPDLKYIDYGKEQVEEGIREMVEDRLHENKLYALWKVVEDFIEEQNITCPEAVCQSDRVILNAYDFIEKCCDIVGYKEIDDD